MIRVAGFNLSVSQAQASRLGWLLSRVGLLVLGLVVFSDPAAALPRAGTSGTAKGISVDIDEPTKPDGGALRALADTVWIADWSFDSGGGCTSTGWTKYDNRILNDGSNYWSLSTAFNGQGGISNRAAVLAKHDLCWEQDGYGNGWDYSVILKYKGTGSTLSFDFLSDSEPANDFVSIEADSAGASEALVNYTVRPANGPSFYRVVLLAFDGSQPAGNVSSLALPDFGVPSTTHEVYIRFLSDDSDSDEDGLYLSAVQAGLVVDNVAVAGGALAYSENFEGALNANVSLANTAPATPFGEWARLFSHITDNDKCVENTTCAWLFSDPLRIATFPDMAFGPGNAVVHSWLDDILVSPWVSLTTTPSATHSLLSFRIFPGQRFEQSKIVQGWRVRGRYRLENTDTSAPGDSIDCVTAWSGRGDFSQSEEFTWETRTVDLATQLTPLATALQVSFRTVDWQLVSGEGPPVTLDTGPGPYIDHVRIGRRVGTGPAMSIGIDPRTQAQDCFATVQNAITPGEHFSPDGTNRFGTCAFSSGVDLGTNAPGSSPNLITGDSITVIAVDARNVGGLASVKWYGAITAGPHAGKAPAPYTIGGNGFFEVIADSARTASGIVMRNTWFVDLDDTYFRGGDALVYFWRAVDLAGGGSSVPDGFGLALPASVSAAEVTASGLLQVNYLPTINWDPAYLARIAADAHGDLAPTVGELANSTQKNCLLYIDGFLPNRKSGSMNRSSFMYTLDELGYRGYYDIYDSQGLGNTNNQIGGRANVAQASGYALIVQDAGRLRSGTLPNGGSNENSKINQAQWYRDYLAQGLTGLAGSATFWAIGDNFAYANRTNALLTTDMGSTAAVDDQGLNVNPNVSGINSFTFTTGTLANFVGDVFTLEGGCPNLSSYDGLTASGGAILTHRYVSGTTSGPGAVLMNKNTTLKWNTILSSFGWYDIRDAFMGPPSSPQPGPRLANKILNGVLPNVCKKSPNPVDSGDPVLDAPQHTALHACVPNPFNPTTSLRYDLAQAGQVRIGIYNAAGRLVSVLIDAPMPVGRHVATWHGLDSAGRRMSSGIYFARLVSGDFVATQKLVLLK